MTRIDLEPVDRVRVTILMDNVTDPLIHGRPLLAAAFPDAFVQSTVGMTIEL